MDLKQVQSQIVSLKNELAKVPQMEQRLHRLLGMEEILLVQEEESNKPDLKVASSDATG
jgi:hypothetical protein|tara:strand:+ start:59 stop:235 length:177 start_codon:yes stop_codon:yes gene_type:complete